MEQLVDVIIGFVGQHLYILLGLLVVEQVLPHLPFIKANSSLQFIVDICKGLDAGVRKALEALKAPPPPPAV